jgi:hypothetical protein
VVGDGPFDSVLHRSVVSHTMDFKCNNVFAALEVSKKTKKVGGSRHYDVVASLSLTRFAAPHHAQDASEKKSAAGGKRSSKKVDLDEAWQKTQISVAWADCDDDEADAAPPAPAEAGPHA